MNSFIPYISEKIRNIAWNYINPATEERQVEMKDLLQLLTDISLSDDKVHLLLQQIRDSIRMPINYNEATNTTNIAWAVTVSWNITTVSAVTSLTNQVNIWGYAADLMAENNSRQDWGVTIRSLIK